MFTVERHSAPITLAAGSPSQWKAIIESLLRPANGCVWWPDEQQTYKRALALALTKELRLGASASASRSRSRSSGARSLAGTDEMLDSDADRDDEVADAGDAPDDATTRRRASGGRACSWRRRIARRGRRSRGWRPRGCRRRKFNEICMHLDYCILNTFV